MFPIKSQEANESEYWLLLTTVDSGMGIPKNVQKKIFEPFVSNIDEASRKDYGKVFKINFIEISKGLLDWDWL